MPSSTFPVVAGYSLFPVPYSLPVTDRPHDAALPHLALLLRGDADGLRAAGGPDWPACAALALHHGLGPLLYQRGRRMADAWPMPADVERELRTSYMGATLENGAWLTEAVPAAILAGAPLPPPPPLAAGGGRHRGWFRRGV